MPTDCTRRRSRVRRAVTATDMASFGSFLFDRPVPSTRVRAANVAGTSTTASPAVTSCCASRNPSPSAPSIAHSLDGNGAAHVNRCSTWLRLARTLSRASSSSSPLTATAVWVALCGSIPMITCITTSMVTCVDGTVVGTPTLDRVRAGSPLSSHTTAKPQSDAPRSQVKPTKADRQAHLEQPDRDLTTLDTKPTSAISLKSCR